MVVGASTEPHAAAGAPASENDEGTVGHDHRLPGLGSYRAAARLCGASDKTVKRVLGRRLSASYEYRARPPALSNTEVAREVVVETVRSTDGLITAKRLLPLARAAGYRGSLRTLRRLVAKVKREWRRRRRRLDNWPVGRQHLSGIPSADPGRSFSSTRDQPSYKYYERVRNGDKPLWDEDRHAWVLPSYAACRHVLVRDDTGYVQPERDNDLHAEIHGGARVITRLAGEEHHRMHHWWLRAFTPRVMDEWRRQHFRPIVDVAIDRFVTRGAAELWTEFADRMPVRVIAAAMGLPWEDHERIERCKALDRKVVDFFGQLMGTVGDRPDRRHPIVARALAATEQLNQLLLPFVLERQAGTDDDLISRMCRDARRDPPGVERRRRPGERSYHLPGWRRHVHIRDRRCPLRPRDLACARTGASPVA